MVELERTPKQTKVGIVIPVLSQFRMAIEAIHSIQTEHDYRLYIVPQWELRWALSKAWNSGVQDAIREGCSHILVINDDILFSAHTIDALVYELETDKRLAMATGINQRDSVSQPYDVKEINKPTVVEKAESPDFSCFMITPESYEKIGVFDENFFPAYFEDNDYHYRIKLSELKAIATTAAPYYHYGSRTQNGGEQPIVPGMQFDENRNYYAKKWGGVPGDEKFTVPFDDKSLSPFGAIPEDRR